MNPSHIADPIYIARPPALERLAATLLHEPLVAVDTESNSLHAYYERVCLIQFSTLQHDYLVDPLALPSLAPLEPLFSNPQIEKIFHAAEYDIICLKRDYGFSFANLFDTMLAVRILGREEIGLAALLEQEFGVIADKRYQRADWGERPLTRPMLSYAQLDTHYLTALRGRLMLELKEKGLWSLAQEDFQRLCLINGRQVDENRDGNGSQMWRMHGAHDLEPQNAAVLAELCRYRDLMARQMDRPLFKVISDNTLIALAEACPKKTHDLEQIKGMTSRQVARHGRGLLEAVAQGLKAPPMLPPRQPRPDERYLERLDRLRTWRKVTAQKMGVSSDVVMPRDLLYAIAEKNPSDLLALGEILQSVPWRLGQFGGDILKVLEKNKR